MAYHLTLDKHLTPTSVQHNTYQVHKSTIWGLPRLQEFNLTIYAVGADGTVSQDPAYTTSKQRWIRPRLFLPPSFNLLAGTDKDVVADVRYKGWEGMIGFKSEIFTPEPQAALIYVHDIHSHAEAMERRLQIRRKGAGRDYDLTISPSGQHLIWKGTGKVSSVDDGSPNCLGNLKLKNTANPFQPEILAVWKNRTDLKILGSLIVFEAGFEGLDISLEEMLASCLAIVLSERLTMRGWLGGMCGDKATKKGGQSEIVA